MFVRKRKSVAEKRHESFNIINLPKDASDRPLKNSRIMTKSISIDNVETDSEMLNFKDDSDNFKS
jgi:hypothetical protein